MQDRNTDQIVRTVIQEMEQTFTTQETERLLNDDQFRMVASLYHRATHDLNYKAGLACNQRVRTALERALREHAQRLMWNQSSPPTPDQ